MIILLTTVHVIACVILVLVVLLQAGKGADMGAVFGGASSTIFGSSGAGNFLTRLTTGAAVVFMATSLGLTYVSSHGGSATIMPESGLPKTAPAADAGAPAADSEPAAVADSAPAAAPAEGGDAAPTEPKGAAAAPAAEAPAPAAAPEAAPAAP